MKNQKQQINQAVKILQTGGVIAYPTEAVYGLGCDPKKLSGVKKILELKQRNKEKGLILVASSFEQFKSYILPLEHDIETKLLKSWGDHKAAVTWLVPADKNISEYLRGEFDTLAIRVSHHPDVKELCEKFGGAIISTSANIAAQEAARTTEQVKQIFGDKIGFILEGKTNTNAQPSEIRDALTNTIIRTAN